ncbi:MAG: beta-galactosidase [Nitriliruptoraceae bacterium]|nr:beta-galactosidase [Nitriliruptoraceae bacterium]
MSMRFGVCYYPEQWPRDRWAIDAAQMAELGLDLVRIGEFAWSTLEPARGQLHLDWLDEAITTLADAGLSVVLGTPTATPPVWLMRERPEILSVGPDGRRRAYGSRRHTSPVSAAYREESARIVRTLVDRYGSNEAIVAWQLDNEPGNHDSARDYSDEAAAAFRAWLAARFDGSIDALNEAWGTAFWSMSYPSFETIELPVPTMTEHNPSLELAHLEFAAAMAAEALDEQRAIVTAGAPGREVLTNLYLGEIDVDPRQVARPGGIGAIDIYPHGVDGPADVSFLLDLARGSALPADAGVAANGGRGWIIEQQPGPVNWTGDNPAVPAGQVRLWCWQAALHGIETLLWFRWRAARTGQEQHHAALLRHDGSRSSAWDEAARFLAEYRAVADAEAAGDPDAAGTTLARPPARVALVHEHLDAWALEVVPQTHGASHRHLVTAAHTAARRLGLDVDVVPADADLTGYEVVLAPALHVVDDQRVARLEAALDAGVRVVLGPRSLVRDHHHRWIDTPVPGGLADRLGARVDHAGSPTGWPRRPDHRSSVRFVASDHGPRAGSGTADARQVTDIDADTDGVTLPAGPWVDTLVDLAEDVEVLATTVGAPLDGAVVAVHRGGLCYLGVASVEAWTTVLSRLLDRRANPDHLAVYERAGRTVTIDHTTLHIDGLGPLAG